MNFGGILEILIGDVFFAGVLAAVNIWSSNRGSRQLEKEMLQMKEILALHFENLEKELERDKQ